MKKSYWSDVYIGSDSAKDAVRSWFREIVDPSWEGPIRAALLCREVDDRELKIRAVFKTTAGEEREAIRSRTRSGYDIVLRDPGPWPTTS